MLGYEAAPSALGELALALIRTSATHIVMGARQPDEGLRAALAETKARFVVALDDPRIAVADILIETDADLREITRAVANSCPFVMRFGLLDGALTIPGKGTEGDAIAVLSAIARHFQIVMGESDAVRIVDELADIGLVYPGTSAEDWSSRIPDAGKPMVDGALAAYAGAFSGGAIGQIVWTRDLFIVASDPGKRPTDVLDVSSVSGTDRFLIYGPYIQLPPDLGRRECFSGSRETPRRAPLSSTRMQEDPSPGPAFNPGTRGSTRRKLRSRSTRQMAPA